MLLEITAAFSNRKGVSPVPAMADRIIIGCKHVDADVILRLAARVGDADMKQLLKARPGMPGWMGDVILKISSVHSGRPRKAGRG